MCELLVRVSLGEVVAPLPAPRAGVRTHQGFLVLMAMALEGASRRELAAELWRRWRGKGMYADSRDEITRPGDDLWSIVPSLAVSLLLLARPAAGRSLVRRTVSNYALHRAAVRRIQLLETRLGR